VGGLEFALLGAFEVRRDGRRLALGEVGTRKARTLLKLLLLEPGRVVPVDRIVDAIWGDDLPAKPEDNVATMVSRLRATLGADVVGGGRGGYAASATNRVDVVDAEALVRTGELRLADGDAGLARAAADQALALLSKGPVLVDEPDAAWADEARRHAERLVRRARAVAWDASLTLDDVKAARAVAEAAVAADPLDEEAHRALMRSDWRAGQPARALATYGALRSRLADELGADPGPETEALYLAILRDEAEPDDRRAEDDVVVASEPTLAGGPDLVGRSHELARLEALWRAAVDGHPALVIILGEAGIGKSGLANAAGAIAVTTGGLLVDARCYDAERSLPIQPFIEAIRSAASRLHPDTLRRVMSEGEGPLGQLVPEIAGTLHGGRLEPVEREIEERRVFEAVAGFFRRLADHQPVLLLIDDVHQAGTATVELLHFLVRRLRSDRMLVVATMRPDEAQDVVDLLSPLATTIELGPLDDGAIAEIATSMGAPELAAPVARLTRGHTLYVLEALRAVTEIAGEERSGVQIPPTLQDAVLTRVRRAGRAVEELLRGAVILGSAWEVTSTAALLGIPLEDAVQRAERALAARLVIEVGPLYEFANDLIRDVIYDSTPAPTRVARHRVVAGLVRDNPEAVARHAAAAGESEQAMTAWEGAAARATQRFANRDAERSLTEALAAAAHVDDPTAEARIRLARGRAHEQLGDYTEAHEDHRVALELARVLGDAGLEASALERLGWTAYYARDARAADHLAAQANELAAAAAAAQGARPGALLLAGRLRHWHGDLEGAERVFRDTLAAANDDHGLAWQAECQLGSVLAHRDEWLEACRLLDAAVLDAGPHSLLRPLLGALFFGALAHGQLGDLGGALQRLARKQQLLDKYDLPYYRARTATTTAWVYGQVGDWARASDHAARALELSWSTAVRLGAGELHERAHAQMVVAECAFRAGDADEATRQLDATDALLGLDLPFERRWELRLAELRSLLDPPRAEALLDLARLRGTRKYEALALAALGHRAEAAAVARPLGSDLLIARVAPEAEARAAADRVVVGLPQELRASFMTSGPPADRAKGAAAP